MDKIILLNSPVLQSMMEVLDWSDWLVQMNSYYLQQKFKKPISQKCQMRWFQKILKKLLDDNLVGIIYVSSKIRYISCNYLRIVVYGWIDYTDAYTHESNECGKGLNNNQGFTVWSFDLENHVALRVSSSSSTLSSTT